MNRKELLERLQKIVDGIDNAAGNPIQNVRADLLKVIEDIKKDNKAAEEWIKENYHRYI